MLWQFPSRAVQIPATDFDSEYFQSALALFLDKAGTEQLSHLVATAHKAGKELQETRNSGSPELITHMLLSALMAIGGLADVPLLEKRVHDDVSFSHGENGPPWRRSPFWLVLRVAAQRQLSLAFENKVGRAAYKLLITTVLSNLLDDCVASRTEPALVSMLQKKICRRLAKFEKHADARLPEVRKLLRTTASTFQQSVDAAQRYVEQKYSEFKKDTIRNIPDLPFRIPLDSSDFQLSLPASSSYLGKLISSVYPVQKPRRMDFTKPNSDLENLNLESGASNIRSFTQNVLRVSKVIKDANTITAHLGLTEAEKMTPREAKEVCSYVYGAFTSLIESAGPMIDKAPDHNSRLLLAIFSLWVAMDAAAAVACPQLKDYQPVFKADLLSVLQLPSLKAMKRLRGIQDYLETRSQNSVFVGKTILSRLDEHSFGSCYAQSSQSMLSLQESIEDLQHENRQLKTAEWEKACDQYDEYSENILAHSCCCTINMDGTKNISGCVHCFSYRKRKRMSIDVCEDLLPEDEALASAVVFELDVPEFIAKYRSMSWSIITQFTYPNLPVSKAQLYHLKEHTPLADAFSSPSNWLFRISMASSVKAVMQTHYRTQRMKTDIDSVLVPLGSRFQLYDSRLNIWVSDLDKPLTLAHWCGIHVPKSLVTTVLPISSHPVPNPDGPSSYAAVTSRPLCPQDMSVHEFEAFQRLLSGNSRRWLTMLTELGSLNVNFSKADTMLVFTQLAAQAGPMIEEGHFDEYYEYSRNEILGVCHSVLMESHFVQRLLDEIGKRLVSIRSNWREANTMEILITLTLRIHALTNDNDRREAAFSLLQSARSATLGWIHTLSRDVNNTREGDVAYRGSMYAFKAALACRSSFSIFTQDAETEMEFGDVSDFLCASIALQRNLVVDINKLPKHGQNAIRRDCVLAHELKAKLHTAITFYPDAVESAIAYGLGSDSTLSGATAGNDKGPNELDLGPWQFLSGQNDGWMTSTITRAVGYTKSEQRVDFHYTDGHLLVDGKTVGKLPQDIRDSDEVKEVFGDAYLLTFPSYLPGMSHCLNFHMSSHEIHFGRQDGRVVIVSIFNPRLYGHRYVREYVPRRIFISPNNVYDLPRPLVDNCIHWYSRQTGHLECRQKDLMWKDRPNDWKLDVQRRQAQRNQVYLADPHSIICKKIARIFKHFDDVQRLIVFQPLKNGGSLSVELRHLELHFFVNRRGCLQCRQLRAEVDPDQDAGTLYGFQSMIVMRDMQDFNRRSIITPMGEVKWFRSGAHFVVQTIIENAYNRRRDSKAKSDLYARFSIDDLVGRLTCPPEPRLLYTKAQLHAFTSCPLPDPLTGRTGEEEAIHTLTSGRCQPWNSGSDVCTTILHQIEKLAPVREFYPKDMRVLQEVKWDNSLPVDMQRDRYRRLARELREKFQRLSYFSPDSSTPGMPQNQRDAADFSSALQKRGEVQRLRFETPLAASNAFATTENMDLRYNTIGRVESASAAAEKFVSPRESALAVYQVCRMLRDRPSKIPSVRRLKDIMNEWRLIGGFHSPCDTDMMPLMAFMESQTFGERWGGFVELCRTAAPEQQFQLMLSLALLAFAPGADMDAIRLLAAYSYIPSLRSVPPPSHISYAAFKFDEKPTSAALAGLITPCYTKYEPTAHSLAWKTRYAEEEKMRRHAERCDEAGLRLAAQVLAGWPQEETPFVQDFPSEFIDVNAALGAIAPEWKRLRHNKDLSDYVAEVEGMLAPIRTAAKKSMKKASKGSAKTTETLVPARPAVIPSLSGDLASVDMKPLPKSLMPLPPSGLCAADNGHRGPPSVEISELRQILVSFLESPNSMRRAYSRDLSKSVDALEKSDIHAVSNRSLPSIEDVNARTAHAAGVVRGTLQHLKMVFSLQDEESTGSESGSGSDQSHEWLQRCGLWPRLTPVTLLELLRSDSGSRFGKQIKQALTFYGCAITSLQRLRRVQRLLQRQDTGRQDTEKILAEWQNHGHTTWKHIKHADWLLMEIDGDFLIRPEQVDVANAIIAPQSQKNSVLQLNMGKGMLPSF